MTKRARFAKLATQAKSQSILRHLSALGGFDIRHSIFIRLEDSLFQSFVFNLTGRFLAGDRAEPGTLIHHKVPLSKGGSDTIRI